MGLVTEVIERLSEESELHSDNVSQTIREKMSQVLDELISEDSGFFGATISSIDGIAWAENIAPGFDKHRFAAMSSSLLAISDELASEVERGATNNVLIEGEAGKILIMHAGPLLLLTIFTKKDLTLGMALAHAKVAAGKIEAMHV